jgi:glycosyltransferase involved in cell wall biosynthesis
MAQKCVVIIPALNEMKTIGKLIDDIPRSLFDGNVLLDVVVVDDGSSDGTGKIAHDHGAYVIKHNRPMGVGVAFSDGIKEALKRRADYALNIDADGQMNPKDIVKLLSPLYDGEFDMVTASRFIDSSRCPQMPAIKKWGNAKVANIISLVVQNKYYDVSCGFRAYNKEALLRLTLHGRYTYTQETFINLASCSHIRIKELPVDIRGEREYGKSRVASSIIKYAIKSGSIILSAIKEYRPSKFFGSLSVLSFIIGAIFEVLMLSNFLQTGRFRNYLWAGLTGAFFAIASMFFLVLLIVSDTLGKINRNEEEILYLNRFQTYYMD